PGPVSTRQGSLRRLKATSQLTLILSPSNCRRNRYRPSPLQRTTVSPLGRADMVLGGPPLMSPSDSLGASAMTNEWPSGETLVALTPSGVIGFGPLPSRS